MTSNNSAKSGSTIAPESTRKHLCVSYILSLAVIMFSCSQANNQLAELVTLDDRDTGDVFILSGLYPTEGSRSDKWRWGTGQTSSLYFYMDKPGIVIISGTFENPHTGQTVRFSLNGKELVTLSNLPKNEDKAAPLTFNMEGMANQGRNILEISYSHWTGNTGSTSTDTRNFSVKYRKLTITTR